MRTARRTAWILMGLILVGGATCTAYLASRSPALQSLFELEKIEYRGGDHLDFEELDALIRSAFPSNTLAIDLDLLRHLVESEKWVKSATVRRRLPERIIVHLEERSPAAVATIDGNLEVVDEEGVVLSGFGPEYQSLDRPIVRGLRNVAMENARRENVQRMRLYLEVLEALSTPSINYSASLSEIDVSNPDKVAVVPSEDPVPIYLGKSRFLERYQAFLSQIDLYHELKEQHGQIKSVDVTFDNKIIIHTAHEERATGNNERWEKPSE